MWLIYAQRNARWCVHPSPVLAQKSASLLTLNLVAQLDEQKTICYGLEPHIRVGVHRTGLPEDVPLVWLLFGNEQLIVGVKRLMQGITMQLRCKTVCICGPFVHAYTSQLGALCLSQYIICSGMLVAVEECSGAGSISIE